MLRPSLKSIYLPRAIRIQQWKEYVLLNCNSFLVCGLLNVGQKMATDENNEDAAVRARKAVQLNERFNVPEQTEKEEAESHGKAEAENLADDKQIAKRKEH